MIVGLIKSSKIDAVLGLKDLRDSILKEYARAGDDSHVHFYAKINTQKSHFSAVRQLMNLVGGSFYKYQMNNDDYLTSFNVTLDSFNKLTTFSFENEVQKIKGESLTFSAIPPVKVNYNGKIILEEAPKPKVEEKKPLPQEKPIASSNKATDHKKVPEATATTEKPVKPATQPITPAQSEMIKRISAVVKKEGSKASIIKNPTSGVRAVKIGLFDAADATRLVNTFQNFQALSQPSGKGYAILFFGEKAVSLFSKHGIVNGDEKQNNGR